jgi:hypothetical protein
MERKLVRIGSSLAVTIPSEVVREFRLEKGQSVQVAVHPVTGAVTITPGIALIEGGKATRRLRDASRSLLRRRAKLYRELAK